MGHEALNQVIDEVPPVLSASPMLNVEVLFFICFSHFNFNGLLINNGLCS